MKLKIGVMTNKELAKWFGVKESSFKALKQKKLKELENFAKFKLIKGKVEIEEIFIEEYNKKGSEAYEMIKDKLDATWNDDGLDSCSRVSEQLVEELSEALTVSPSTVYAYTRKSRNELYGIPFQEGGKLGSCQYLWCKKEGEGANATYRRLTAEEEEIKQKLISKYFGDATEKQIFVKGMVATGEIKEEDAWGVLEELTGMGNNNFMGFLLELQEAVGCQVIRGTQVDRYLSNCKCAFELEEPKK